MRAALTGEDNQHLGRTVAGLVEHSSLVHRDTVVGDHLRKGYLRRVKCLHMVAVEHRAIEERNLEGVVLNIQVGMQLGVVAFVKASGRAEDSQGLSAFQHQKAFQ